MRNLLDLLPALALLTAGLSGLESLPTTALAHSPRSPQDVHRHLASRQRLSGSFGGAQAKRGAGGLKKNKRGTTCRPRDTPSSAAPTNNAAAASQSPAPPPPSAPSPSPASSDPAPPPPPPPASSEAPPPSQAAPSPSASTDPNGNLLAVGASVNVGSNGVSVNVGVSGITGGWLNTGSKMGAAWPNGNYAQPSDPNYIGNYCGSKTAWYYSWSPFSVGAADSLGLEFVPMYWGPKQQGDWYGQQGSWPSTVKNALFFNEPNEPSQCNMGAGDSVQYWMNDMVPLRHNKGIALGGAATTNAPSGLQWVQDMMNNCQQYGNSKADCTPDFIPIHWYSTDVNEFQQYVSNFHAQTGLDIWVTEYACQSFTDAPQCDEGQTWNLHQTMAAWFDSQDYVKRYSPFGMMEQMQGVNQMNALMSPSGDRTDLGSWYINSA